MITDEMKAAAQLQHDAHQRQMESIDNQIERLHKRRLDHERKAWEAKLILDGIEPCRTCKRKVQSPCHDRVGMAENGPWDGFCREFLYPERAI